MHGSEKKLEDEFTPRLDFDLAALEGQMHRDVKLRVSYIVAAGAPEYSSILTVVPRTGEMLDVPAIGRCAKTGTAAPKDCIGRCEVTGHEVLRHLLSRSELSGRHALPEHTGVCSLSNKRGLADELQMSAVSGEMVANSLLKTSALSGKRAEPDHFAQCEFTGAELLKTELAQSEASDKLYRIDEQLQSVVSGKRAHKQEFVTCWETHQPLLATEAERCAVTGKIVRPGVLAQCAITQLLVLPSELERSAASGNRALRRFFVTSSCSGARLLEGEAVVSVAGAFCAPREAKMCRWTGQLSHPDDLTLCALTDLGVSRSECANGGARPALQVLAPDLLRGVQRTAERSDLWPAIEAKASAALSVRRCRVEAAQSSPDGKLVAVCLEVPTLLGLVTQHTGCIYSIPDDALVGRVVRGKRKNNGWIATHL